MHSSENSPHRFEIEQGENTIHQSGSLVVTGGRGGLARARGVAEVGVLEGIVGANIGQIPILGTRLWVVVAQVRVMLGFGGEEVGEVGVPCGLDLVVLGRQGVAGGEIAQSHLVERRGRGAGSRSRRRSGSRINGSPWEEGLIGTVAPGSHSQYALAGVRGIRDQAHAAHLHVREVAAVPRPRRPAVGGHVNADVRAHE